MHAGASTLSDGDSWLASNDLSSSGTLLQSSSDEFVISNTKNTYELSYSSGTTTIMRTSPDPSVTLAGTDPSSFAIDNLFVSSAKNKYALWEICGIGKLNTFCSCQVSDYTSLSNQ